MRSKPSNNALPTIRGVSRARSVQRGWRKRSRGNAHPFSKFLHGFKNSHSALTRSLRTASRSSVRPQLSLVGSSDPPSPLLTEAIIEDFCGSNKPPLRNPDSHPFEWPCRRYGVSSPCSDLYGRCLDRRWSRGGGRCHERNRSLPRTYGLRGHRPSSPARSRT
jgi:hypothetical protein